MFSVCTHTHTAGFARQVLSSPVDLRSAQHPDAPLRVRIDFLGRTEALRDDFFTMLRLASAKTGLTPTAEKMKGLEKELGKVANRKSAVGASREQNSEARPYDALIKRAYAQDMACFAP